MSDRRGTEPPEEPGGTQLRMWDEERREAPVGTLVDEDAEWTVIVQLEPVAGDLFRGRLSFRSEEERHDTAPVLVEESAAAVVRRAGELPTAMLRQLLASARS